MRYRIGRIPRLRAGRNKISWQKIQAQLDRGGSADLDQLAKWCVDHDHAAGGQGFVRYCIDNEWLVPVTATPGEQPTQPASDSDALNRSGETSSTGDSGIYIAILLTDQYMPVTRDPRYVATCACVNSENVKVGKAQSFRIRESNYWQDFDRHNVEFIPLARLTEIDRAETAILRRLDCNRLLSPKNSKMDWLVGISPEEAVRTVYAALDNGSFDYQAISNRFAP
jgi:hypothetical protein